jgi:hypothetical protein
MDAADIRAFARRDWASLEDEKARFWAHRKSTMSPSEALAVADDLRAHAQALKPDWPDPAERAADLALHRRVSEAHRACSKLRSR